MRRFFLVGAVLLLAACSSLSSDHYVNQPWLESAIPLEEEAREPFGPAAQSVNKPWLLGAAQPLKPSPVLPAILRSTQTFSFSLEEALPSLDEMARRLSQLSELQVTISPEARLPLAHFLPRLNVDEGVGKEPLQQGGLILEQLRLPELLNRLATAYSVSWRYQQGRIELYRTETRQFHLPTSVGALALEALNKQLSTGPVPPESVSGEGQGAAGLQNLIEPFLSRAGTFKLVSGMPPVLLVTDTPSRLDALGLYLDQQAAQLVGRRGVAREEAALNRGPR